MRFNNIRFARDILAALKEKNGSGDGFEFRPEVVLSFSAQKSGRHVEIVILGIKLRRHLQSFLSIVEVSDRCRAKTFERGPVGVSRFTRRIFPKIAHFEFTGSESRELIIGKYAEVFRRDWTRTNRDNCAHGIRVCARISEAEDHSP